MRIGAGDHWVAGGLLAIAALACIDDFARAWIRLAFAASLVVFAGLVRRAKPG